jgi:hypothetical protein
MIGYVLLGAAALGAMLYYRRDSATMLPNELQPNPIGPPFADSHYRVGDTVAVRPAEWLKGGSVASPLGYELGKPFVIRSIRGGVADFDFITGSPVAGPLLLAQIMPMGLYKSWEAREIALRGKLPVKAERV